MTILGPMIPVLHEKYRIGLSQAGLLPFVQGLGGVILQIAGIFIVSRFSKIKTIGVIYTIYCLSFLLLFFASSYVWIVSAFLIIGATSRLFDTVANAYLVVLEDEKRGFYMNILHAIYGCGALTGSLLVGWLFSNFNVSLNEVFLTLFAFCAAILFYISFKFRGAFFNKTFAGKPAPKDVRAKTPNFHISKVLTLLLKKDVAVYIALAFGYVGFSASLSAWLPSRVLQTEGATIFFAGMAVSIFWVGIISGRFVSSILIQKFSAKRLLPITNLVCGAVLLMAIVLNSTPELLMTIYFLAGFFIGPTMPLAILAAKNRYGDDETIIPIIMVFSTVGLMIVPWAIGNLAEVSGLHTALSILNLFPFVMGFLAMRLMAREPK
jgi:fucose permease